MNYKILYLLLMFAMFLVTSTSSLADDYVDVAIPTSFERLHDSPFRSESQLDSLAATYARDWANEILAGRAMGKVHGSKDAAAAAWFVGSFMLSIPLNLVGTYGLATGALGASRTVPEARLKTIRNRSAAYQVAYTSMYIDTRRSERAWASIAGGTISSVLAGGFIAAIIISFS